jgi:hypothetical protein
MDLDYNTRLAAIQRNEKLAQIMQQQAFQPVDIQSYQGIQAPISPLSGLAKVLQAYMGAKGTGDEERIKLNQEAKVQAQQMLSGLQDRPASPGRAAVMGMPEIQAQPATSFTPMGSDFEDNPNLAVAPSGNVETPAVAYQPAVAPQAAIPPQAAVSLDPEQKRQRLVEIMMGQNPYASPVAKLMYESLEKQNTGPLAEYKLYAEQAKAAGQTPLSIDAYKTRQILAGRAVSNNVVNMPAGAPIPVMRNGKLVLVQMAKDGKYVEIEGISPVPTQTPLAQELADAGITPDNPKFQELATAFINKKLTQVIAPNATVIAPTGETTQAAPPPAAGTTQVIIDGKLTAVPIEQAAELNAKFKTAETLGTEGAKATLDLVTIPDPKNPANKILVQRSQVASQAASGTPAVVEVDKKVAQGESALDLARRAQSILPQATSGAISNLFTMATDAAGIPTNKSAADAQLQVISAGLTANVPRMEGPQSNTDLLEYKRAAANVADKNIPYQTRMKALETVISLNEKYAKTPTAPPGSVRRITPK